MRTSALVRRISAFTAYILLACLLSPMAAMAQSDSDMPLGDLARLVRKKKAPLAETVIDNDNLSKVMDDVQTKRLKGQPIFSIDNAGKNFRMTSPDGTCSLSFDANATPLISDSYVPQEIPQSELVKLDGPAVIDGDTLQLTVYNGTKWNVKEITVGLTIVRHPATTASGYGASSYASPNYGSSNYGSANYGSARLIPASDETTTPAEKRSDLTLLYHLKGSAAPSTTTVFHEALGVQIDQDQEWHWAIVQAAGVLPKTVDAK
jgi:hypothetical protein